MIQGSLGVVDFGQNCEGIALIRLGFLITLRSNASRIAPSYCSSAIVLLLWPYDRRTVNMSGGLLGGNLRATGFNNKYRLMRSEIERIPVETGEPTMCYLVL